MFLEGLNQTLFKMVAAGFSPEPHLLALARWAAAWGLAGVPATLVILWFWRPRARDILLLSAISGGLALLVTEIIAALVAHPRPFMIALSPVYLAHSPEGSFPSAHASLMLAVAGVLIIRRRTAPWGWLLLFDGFATAWSRVYLGLHFPFDILGSALLAAGLATLWGRVVPAWVICMRGKIEALEAALKRAFRSRLGEDSGSGAS